MAITDIVVSGKLYQDDGDAVSGATVALLETGTTTTEASTTTDSNGAWAFTETSLDTTYDIKITSGTSVRYILWSDEITAKGVDTASLKVRGAEGAVAPIYLFADQADDAGDGWRIQASASDTLAIGSDKASAGTIIDYITITNGGNAAASSVALAGTVTVGTSLNPDSADGATIGSASAEWSDLYLADSSVVYFGADQDTTLTHTDGSGLTLNSTNKIMFNDASQFIQGTSATVLALGATDEIDLTATAIDINGTADISGTLTLGTVAAAGSDTDKFLVLDGSGNVDYRTGTQVLSDIGGVSSSGMTSFQLEDDDGTEVAISEAKEVKIIGSGVTTNWTDTDNGTDGDPYDLTITVDAAQTGITSILATDVKIGEDDQTKIDFETADEIHFYAANAHEITLAANEFSPNTSDGIALGTGSKMWSDLFLASGGVINFNNGDVTLTHSSNALTIAGGSVTVDSLTVDNFTLNGTELDLSSGDFTIDVAGDTIIDSDGGDLILKDATVEYGRFTNATLDPDGTGSSAAWLQMHRWIRYIQVIVADPSTALTTGDGKAVVHIPIGLNGYELVEVHAEVNTAPAGSTIIVEVSKNGASTQMLSTNITIDASETGSDTAATAPVVQTNGNEDVSTNNTVQINVTQVGSSTAGSGLIVTMGFAQLTP